MLTDRQCGSGHSIVKHVRCSAPTASCGKPCGHMVSSPLISVLSFGFKISLRFIFDLNQRECGLHACQRTCHSGPCANVSAVASASSTDALSALIVSCQQTCARPRRDCGHACALPCHPHALECPIQSPCIVPVPATCECGRLSKSVTCQSTRSGDQSKAFHLPCDSVLTNIYQTFTLSSFISKNVVFLCAEMCHRRAQSTFSRGVANFSS